MKNRVTKRLLSWLMSAVMIVGEFGGMPLVANAYEDTQEEVVEAAEEVAEDTAVAEDDAAADQAVIVDNSAATEVAEEITADDDVVNEDAQNDPVQVNENPVLADGVVSWNVLPLNAGVDLAGIDGERLYDRNGITYVSETSHEIGVSTSSTCGYNSNNITWISGGFDLIFDNGELYGNIPVDRIIGEMYVWEKEANSNLDPGSYYVYIKSNLTNNITKASDASFAFAALQNNPSGEDNPVAKWTVFHDCLVKKDGENHWIWWDENDPDDNPDEYDNKDNLKVIVPHGGDNAVAYNIKVTGTVLDRGNEFSIAMDAGDMDGASCTYALIDNFTRVQVQAIRNDGSISNWVDAALAKPWESDRNGRVVEDREIYNEDQQLVSFRAPDFTNEITEDNGRRFDNNGNDDPDDDLWYVDGFGYCAYLENPRVNDESKWTCIGIEARTLSENGIDKTYIDKNSILIEMARMSMEDGFEFENGVYNVYPEAGFWGENYYYTVSFPITFNNSIYAAQPTVQTTEIKYRSNPNWAKARSNEDSSLEFWNWIEGDQDDNRRAVEAENNALPNNVPHWREIKHIQLSVDDDADTIGYIVKTPGNDIIFGDGRKGNCITGMVYAGNRWTGTGNFGLDVDPDFDYRNLTIIRVTATGAATATGAEVLVAEHNYDGLPKTLTLTLDEAGKEFSWTPRNGAVLEREGGDEEGNTWKWYEFDDTYYYGLVVSSEDLDAKQDYNNWEAIEPVALNKVTGQLGAIVANLVRENLGGDDSIIAGKYNVVLIEGERTEDDDRWIARSNAVTIDLSKLGQLNANATKPQVIYSTGSTAVVRWREDWNRFEYIEDYYSDHEDGKNYWDLSWEKENENAKSERELYVDEQNAILEAAHEPTFDYVPNLEAWLRSSDEDVAGYVVMLPEDDETTADTDEGNWFIDRGNSRFNSTFRGNDEEMQRNCETRIYGLLDKFVDETGIQVIAVYPDGTVSAWNDGREFVWGVDEALPDNDFKVTIDKNAGIISWPQEYLTDANGLVYVDGEPVADGDPGIQLVLDGGNGAWMAVYPPKHWDTANNKAYVNIGDVLVEMANGKYHKVVDGEGENWVKGTYSVYVTKSFREVVYDRGRVVRDENDDIVYGDWLDNTISAVPAQLTFDPAVTTTDPDLKAFWWNLGETYIKIDTTNPWWKETIEKKENESTEGFDKVNKFQISFRTENKNIGGYLIKVNGHILEPNFDEHNYASCYVGFEPDDVAYATGKDCDSTAILYFSLLANAADKYEIQAAAIYKDGTISKFVDVVKGAKEIKVNTPPTNSSYVGKEIDLTGGKLAVTYPDSAEAVIIDMKDAQLSGYDNTKAGKQNIKLSYAGCATTCAIDVLEAAAVKIEIASLPSKLQYDLGTDISPAGGKIKVTYNNGDTSTVDMTAAMLSGYDKNKVGEQTVTVTYLSLTTSFKVTVIDTYQFDPTVQEEPVVGEGMKIFFQDDIDYVTGEDGLLHTVYTGAALKPIVRVTDNRVILTEGVDYKVTYADNIKAGTATVTVKGMGTYTADQTLHFVIDQRSIKDVEIGNLAGTAANKIKPVVVFAGKVLKDKTDYTYTIEGEKVKISAVTTGSFTGETEEPISIMTASELAKHKIKMVKFSNEKPASFVYDGQPKTIDEYLIVTDKEGEEITEYAVSYSDNVNAGTVTVLIIGTGDYIGKVKKTFKIKPYAGSDFNVTCTSPVKYDSKGAKTFVVVSSNETYELLTPGRDFKVKYSNNKKGGATAKFKLTFKGNYKGSKYTEKTEFQVLKPDLGDSEKNVSDNFIIAGDMIFKKKGKYKPKAYVVVDGRLVPEKEYSRTYTDGGNLSAAKDKLNITVETTDKNYSGRAVVSYNVVDGKDKIDVNNKKATINLTDAGKNKTFTGAGDKVKLIPGTDFTVKVGSTVIDKAEDITNNFDIYYANNGAVGKATIILKGKGKYVGAFSGNFTIKKAAIKK